MYPVLESLALSHSHSGVQGVGAATYPKNLACSQFCSTLTVQVDVVLLIITDKIKGSLLCQQIRLEGALFCRQKFFLASPLSLLPPHPEVLWHAPDIEVFIFYLVCVEKSDQCCSNGSLMEV